MPRFAVRRLTPWASLALLASASTRAAAAQDEAHEGAARTAQEVAREGAAPPAQDEPLEFEALQRELVLEPLTPPLQQNADDELRITVSGLVHLRSQFHSQYDLPTTLSHRAAGGAASAPLGQHALVMPWIRLTPQLEWGRKFKIVGQIDAFQGKALGEGLQDVGYDALPRAHGGDLGSYVRPRWLYAEYLSKIGLFRVGMQPNHWGMGILANDGHHAQRFGLPRLGHIAERVLFATKPLGEHGPLTTAIAGDLVFQDNFARLSRGEVAWQGVLATYLESGPHRLGFFGVYRTQKRDRASVGQGYVDDLKVFVLDLAGHTAAALPGRRHAFVYAEAEAALQLGTSSALRSGARPGERATVRGYGAAARVGFAFAAERPLSARAEGNGELAAQPKRYGKLVTEIEWGFASGDADPNDGVQKRFAFDANHRVGLILFDEVLRWSSARAASIAADPRLANGDRPTPGLSYLPTNGGVAGAQYINPTITYRPWPRTSLRGGAVLAQATSDVVSQVRAVTAGRYQNEWGGAASRRDLGIEFDVALEHRMSLANGFEATLGFEGGVLLPGGALADASGQRLRTPWMGVAQMGLLF